MKTQTNETQEKFGREEALLDIELTAEILRRGQTFLALGKTPEEVSHKLAGDILNRKGNYLDALSHYKVFGEVSAEIVRKNQLLYLGLLDQPEYLEKYRELIERHGRRFSDEDVIRKFVQIPQDSLFLNRSKNYRSLVKILEEETGVKFDKAYIREAYVDAINRGYGHCVESVFLNSNHEQFVPRTSEERELVKRLIEKNITADSLATPEYVCNIPLITGVSPPYQLLLDVGRKKAQEVVGKKLHPKYMREYAEAVESIGLPVLAEHLYKISGLKPSGEKRK